MTGQRVRTAHMAVRVRRVVGAVALAAMALYVVAVAEHHAHEAEDEDEACPLCVASSTEDDAILPYAAERPAGRGTEPVATALPTLLVARRPLPYSPRGPPKLCR